MKNKKKLRIAIYKRVSTVDQAVEGSSLRSQEDALLSYIEAHGGDEGRILEEGMIFSDEGVSGAKENRPGLDALRVEIENGNVDAVLVTKIDRLFRETSFLLAFVKFLQEHKVNLISKSEKIDTTSSMGWFFLTLLGAFATMERDLIRERTVIGKLQKSKEGYFVGGSYPPTGYKLDDKLKMKIDDEESKVIREIFDLALEGKSSTEISRIISAKGIETKFEKTKKEGSNRNKKIKNYWGPKTILSILRNTTYKGVYYYGKTTKEYDPISKKYITVKVPIENRVKFSCPKIIDEDLFEKVQDLIESRKRGGRGQIRIFTGKIVCGLCGFKYHGYKSSKDTMNYKCHNSTEQRAGGKKYICKNTDISEKILRDFSIKKIRELINDPTKFYESYINNDNEFKKIYNNSNKEILGIDSQISKLNMKINNLLEDISTFESGTVRNQIREKIKKTESDLEILLNRKKEVNNKLQLLDEKKNGLKAINEFIKSYNIKLNNLNEEQENELIDIFVKRIVVNFEDITIEMNVKGNDKDRDKYDDLKRKLDELDNKKKLQNSSGGEKGLNNGLKDEHLHADINDGTFYPLESLLSLLR